MSLISRRQFGDLLNALIFSGSEDIFALRFEGSGKIFVGLNQLVDPADADFVTHGIPCGSLSLGTLARRTTAWS